MCPAYKVHRYTERGVLSVEKFCDFFPCELRGPAWVVGSYSISQSAGGTSQNITSKTLRQIGRPALYTVRRFRATKVNLISVATFHSCSLNVAKMRTFKAEENVSHCENILVSISYVMTNVLNH